jgi:hypothetical protein
MKVNLVREFQIIFHESSHFSFYVLILSIQALSSAAQSSFLSFFSWIMPTPAPSLFYYVVWKGLDPNANNRGVGDIMSSMDSI